MLYRGSRGKMKIKKWEGIRETEGGGGRGMEKGGKLRIHFPITWNERPSTD